MSYYEIIYEDGSYSVAQYDSDEEALSAAKAHHTRATEGGPALESAPDLGRAVRIVKVIKYENDPGSIHEDQTLSEDVAEKELETALANATKDGVTDLRVLAANIRDIANPLVQSDPHESNYKADGEELELDWEA